MKKFMLNLAFLLLVSVVANAQVGKIKFIEETLPNGLHVIYSVDKSAPVVSVVVHYKVGSKNEDPKRTGFAHFFEHLMFEGTKNYKRGDFDNFLSEAGSENNAYTSFDQTVYYINLPSNQLKLALWLEASRMRDLDIDEVGIETQRGVVTQERYVRYDNRPYSGWLDTMLVKLYPKGGVYSWPPIGDAEHIAAATKQEFQAFYDKYYVPSNAVLSICGDIRLEDARNLVIEYFGELPNLPAPTFDQKAITTLKSSYKETKEDKFATTPRIYSATLGPKLGDKDRYAVEILWNILFDGESSIFHKYLVEDEEVATFISPLYLDMNESSILGFIGEPTPKYKISDIEKGIDKLISQVRKNGVTDVQLEKAKNMLETQKVYSLKSAQSKAEMLASYRAVTGSTDNINKDLNNYLAVTKTDIKAVIEKYLANPNYVTLIYQPKKQN